MKEKLWTLLGTIGILNEDQKISITNVVVCIFVAITAFRSLFSGLVLNHPNLQWKVEGLDFSATLPLLFSLLNYHSKRMATVEVIKQEPKTEQPK